MGRVRDAVWGGQKWNRIPEGAECAYCSGVAIGWNRVIARADWFVPGCLECNQMLADCALTSVPLRAAWLHRRYRKRFKQILTGTFWDQDEIEELRGGLKALVVETKSAQAELDCRLTRLGIVAGFHWDYLRPNE